MNDVFKNFSSEDEKFYRKKLVELKALTNCTESIIKNGSNDLTNLYSFRERLKALVKDCDEEIEKRL